jgi:hypothetical protein
MHILPLHERGYQLKICFRSETATISEKIFTFSEEKKPTDTIIWDVFTKNGTTKDKGVVSHLFRKQETDEIASLAGLLMPLDPIGPMVLVLDLQHPQTYYGQTELQAITEAEKKVQDAFQTKEKRISALFQQKLPLGLPIDFLILEGRLKADLLTHFDDKEGDFLQKNPIGRVHFCQFAEVFMNGFKFGHQAKIGTTLFSMDPYVKPVSKQFASLQPASISTVLYPPLYQEIYSPTGAFATTMKSAFSITGAKDLKTNITMLKFSAHEGDKP